MMVAVVVQRTLKGGYKLGRWQRTVRGATVIHHNGSEQSGLVSKVSF